MKGRIHTAMGFEIDERLDAIALCETLNQPFFMIIDTAYRIADHPIDQIDQLLPWNWNQENIAA